MIKFLIDKTRKRNILHKDEFIIVPWQKGAEPEFELESIKVYIWQKLNGDIYLVLVKSGKAKELIMTDLTWKRSKWIYGKINLTERVVCQQPPLSCHLTPQEPSEKTINFWRSAHKPTSSSSRFKEDNFPFLFNSIFAHFLRSPLLPPLTKKTWPFFVPIPLLCLQ